MARTFRKVDVSEEYPVPDPDMYTLKFVGIISTREFDNREKPNGPKDVSMYCQFVIDDEDSDWDGTEIRAYFPERVTSGNKTGKLFAAMFGGQLPEHEFDEDDLIGRRFRAMVTKNDRGYPEIKEPIALRERKRTVPQSTPLVADTEPSLVSSELGEPGF